MPELTLEEIVNQHFDEPGCAGRLASYIDDGSMFQRHKDDREFEVLWLNRGGSRRCTIFVAKGSDLCIAQIDIHDDRTLRVEAYEPVSVTVDTEANLLVLTRLKVR